MSPPLDFWRALEAAHSLHAVADDWRWLMGPDYDAGRHCLYPVPVSRADSFPCPLCRQTLRVTPHAANQFIAEHEDDDATCPPLRNLTEKDLQLYAVDWPRLLAAVSDALGLQGLITGFEIKGAKPFAELVCGRTRLPVYLISAALRPQYTLVLKQTSRAHQQPSVLLTLTFDMAFRQLAQGCGHVCLAFCDHLDLKPDGKFIASKAALDELEAFQRRQTPPEAPPPDQSVVAAALQLATTLDNNPRLKAPTHMTVFQLYCAQGLSWPQIEKQTRCAHATLMARKQRLEKTLRAPLAIFRAQSEAFAAMFATMQHPKARRINPKAAIYDDAGFDQP